MMVFAEYSRDQVVGLFENGMIKEMTVQARPNDANIHFSIPDGFCYLNCNIKSNMYEINFVPDGESAHDWTEMITLYLFKYSMNEKAYKRSLENYYKQRDAYCTTKAETLETRNGSYFSHFADFDTGHEEREARKILVCFGNDSTWIVGYSIRYQDNNSYYTKWNAHAHLDKYIDSLKATSLKSWWHLF